MTEDHGHGYVEVTFYTLADIKNEIDGVAQDAKLAPEKLRKLSVSFGPEFDRACEAATWSPSWIRLQCLFQSWYRDVIDTRGDGIRRVVFTFPDAQPAQ